MVWAVGMRGMIGMKQCEYHLNQNLFDTQVAFSFNIMIWVLVSYHGSAS